MFINCIKKLFTTETNYIPIITKVSKNGGGPCIDLNNPNVIFITEKDGDTWECPLKEEYPTLVRKRVIRCKNNEYYLRNRSIIRYK